MSKNIAILLICLFFNRQVLTAQDKVAQIDKLVKAYADFNLFSGSILVAEKGKVIFSRGYGLANREWNIPNTPVTKFRVGSITKQFTSMLIMQLVEEGKIDLQEKVTRYLPSYRKETGDQVTIHHLLTHTSGIPSYTNSDAFENFKAIEIKQADFIHKLCSGDLEFEPGSRFNYNNSGYFLLGAIIETITKKSYAQALQERILDKLGMKNTGFDTHGAILKQRATGYAFTIDGVQNSGYLNMQLPYAAGSLYSTVEDLHIWDRALYSHRLLSRKLTEQLFTAHTKVSESEVGYGWFIDKRKLPGSEKEFKTISHSGGINGFRTLITRFPEDEKLIVLLNNIELDRLGEITQNVLAILNNQKPQMPKPNLGLAILDRIQNRTLDNAVKYYNSLTDTDKKNFDLTSVESWINRWGYQLLDGYKSAKEAQKMFYINVQQFPNSSNVWDSYAEALMKSGDFKNAISNYRKSFSMDSTNNHALQMVQYMEAKPDSIKVRVDGHEMVLYKSGSKSPVIVLEAGGGSNHHCWDKILPELSKHATVITYDRPGFLESEICTKPRTANRVADELKQALQLAGINEPVIIAGWSWGGAFARTFAGKYPSMTKGLLLIDPSIANVYERLNELYPEQYIQMVNMQNNPFDYVTQSEYAAQEATMLQASISDKEYRGPAILLIASDESEFPPAFRPLKRTWIEELQKWSKDQKNIKTEMVNSGHHIAFQRPEIVIAALKELIATSGK